MGMIGSCRWNLWTTCRYSVNLPGSLSLLLSDLRVAD